MKKEKGFTLIELLAVIVILAILMVVAVPKILNVIENSRKSAAESSIKLVKDAIKTQVTSGSIMGTSFTSNDDGCYTFNFDDQTSGNAKKLQLKNKENITGTIKYCNGNFTNNTLSFDGQDMKTIVCKRAEEKTLHTDGTHTFGSIGSKGTLSSGDAFDCNVNGDKTYDSETERFYYVTDMNDSTAVLIYYNNVEKGKPSNSKLVSYDSSGENFHGPRTAIEELPSTSEWRNVSLKNSVRAILNENGGNTTKGETLPSNFSYVGYSARLLTVQEINKACGIKAGHWITGELDTCNYLMENTKYSNADNTAWAWWLENPHSGSSSAACYVIGYDRDVSIHTVSNDGGYGVRPAIEVLKSNIEY